MKIGPIDVIGVPELEDGAGYAVAQDVLDDLELLSLAKAAGRITAAEADEYLRDAVPRWLALNKIVPLRHLENGATIKLGRSDD